MILAAVSTLVTRPENQVWYRAIQPQYWPNALATTHSTRIPTRYSPATYVHPGFPILYLAENHQVALFEVGALLGSPLPGGQVIPNPKQTWIILNVQVTLQAVADLTDIVEQSKLQTTAQELTGDWRGYLARNQFSSIVQPIGPAPTQLLGQAINGVGSIEGFRAISARASTNMSLVVFPNNLRKGSSIVFTSHTGQVYKVTP